MPLTTGARLGPYEILAPLGAGGMGEVYRAKDTRLGRDVAIKILPAVFAQDADRRVRFEREAQAVATLSHPNVVNIFDTGAHNGQLFVVMELLDGETLRERLTHGALPVRKTTELGIQIARGLAAAHEKGLVHRDLKPDNIFLLHDGQVKILDFGLARTAVSAGSAFGATATVAAMTDPGTVMGTVGYMAPEQVRGHAVDARGDLFAFGAVLYEMLSGQRAFQRDTAAETMTAILKEDPPELGGTRAEISPALDRIIRHCLEKNPLERFQTARDVAFALGALSGSNVSSSAMPAVTANRRWKRPAAVAALVVAALALGMFIERRLTPRAATLTFEKKTWDPMWVTNARFGPDGQSIIFSAALTGNVPELFAIRPGSVTPQAIGQKATHLLAVSSKGELAVLTGARFLHHRLFDGTLARMTIDGAPRSWLENVREADWSPDGAALAIIHAVNGQDQLEYPVGRVRHRFGGYLSDLRISPDGSQVAFFEHQFLGDDRGWVKVLTATGEVKTLAGEYAGEEGLAWSPDGRHVMYSASDRGGEIQPFIVTVAGTPVVRQRVPSAGAMVVHDVAADGRLLIIRDDFRYSIRALLPGEAAEREMPWLDFALNGALSRDHQTLMFSDLSQSAGANYAVAIRNVASGSVVRLGEGLAWGLSPDGRWAGSIIPATGDIYLYPTGAGQPVRIGRGPLERYNTTSMPQWFPDGKHILFCGNETAKAPRCYEQDIVGGAPRAVTPGDIMQAMLAPDGRTLLTASSAGEYGIRTIGSDQGAPAHGLTAADVWIGWTEDSRAVVVNVGNAVPARIERVDVATGTRTFLRDVAPPDRSGVVDLRISQWLDGGRGYVYAYQRLLDAIFVVKEGR